MKIDFRAAILMLFLILGAFYSDAQVFFAKDTMRIEVLHPDGLKENYLTPYCYGTLDMDAKAIRLAFKPNALQSHKNLRPHTDAWVQSLFAASTYNWSLDAVLPIDLKLNVPKEQSLNLKSRLGVIGETRWIESVWNLRPGKSAKELVLNLSQDFDLNDPETGLPDKKYKVTVRVKNLVLKQRELSAK